ncbi:MAG TPA: hypothetical protein VF366_05845 [Dehalococcoidia bacterium]|jgi:hypothetical protein
MIIKIAEAALLFGFVGLAMGLYVQLKTLSGTQKKKYRDMIIAAFVFTVFACFGQLVILGVSS